MGRRDAALDVRDDRAALRPRQGARERELLSERLEREVQLPRLQVLRPALIPDHGYGSGTPCDPRNERAGGVSRRTLRPVPRHAPSASDVTLTITFDVPRYWALPESPKQIPPSPVAGFIENVSSDACRLRKVAI